MTAIPGAGTAIAKAGSDTGVRGAECLAPDPVFFLDLSGIFAFPLSSDPWPVRDQGVIVRWRPRHEVTKNTEEKLHGEMVGNRGILNSRHLVEEIDGIDSKLRRRPVIEVEHPIYKKPQIDISPAGIISDTSWRSNQVRRHSGFSVCAITWWVCPNYTRAHWDPNPAYYHMRVGKKVRRPGLQKGSGN